MSVDTNLIKKPYQREKFTKAELEELVKCTQDPTHFLMEHCFIQHPTKGEGWRLRYVSLEGPESAVFYRGRLTGSNTIELPLYWKDLVHEDSITVSIQPIGSTQKIIVMEFDNEKIILSGNTDCFFHVYGERKDVNPLLTEYEGNWRYDYPDPNFNQNSELDLRNYKDPNYEFPRNTITK